MTFLSDSYAQADYLPTPPSLNAQTFLQNINHPVSYYTGTANIEIPVYTIKLKDISIPVSLIYNASGIKVEQESSTVGLGWMLNAGGLISKTIMGENDLYEEHVYFNTSECNGSPHTSCNSLPDITNFYGPITTDFTLTDYLVPNPSWNSFINGNASFEECFNALNNSVYYTSSGGKEFAPDIFNYSFGPYSGTFIFKRDKSIVKEKEDNVIITPNFKYSYGCIDDIESWTAIAPDGTKFTFSQIERVEYNINKICNDCWHLTSIETVSGSVITFSYVKGTAQYKTFSRYQESGPYGIDPAVKIKHQTYNDCWYLQTIEYNGGKLVFIYENDRADASWMPCLKQIDRYISGTKATIWELKQSYFTAGPESNDYPSLSRLHVLGMNDVGYDSNWNTRRLRLDSVLKMPVDKSDTVRYSMTYDEDHLPTKLSAGVDHWGYYNGKLNGSLIARQYHQIETETGSKIYSGGDADRNADEDYSDAYILKTITYPTGGKTTFSYEANRYDPSNMEGDPYKVDYYHEEIEIILEEGEGYNNVPGTAVSAKRFTVPSSSNVTYSATLYYNVDVDVNLYKSLFTADMTLTLSLVNTTAGGTVWSKILKVEELPESWNMTEENSIFDGYANVVLAAGDYELRITGSLRKVLDKSVLECTRKTGIDEYLSKYPYCLGGGLRVKEMRTSSETGDFISCKTFDYTDNGKTSGKLMSFPRYNTGYLTFSSHALRNPGYSVGYSKVTVKDVDGNDNSNGRTEYTFINRPDSNYRYSWESTLVELNTVTGYSVDGNPIGVRSLIHPENGSLLSEKTFNVSGAIVKSIENTYEIISEQKDIIWGISKEYRNIDMSNPRYYNMESIQAIRNDPSTGPAFLNRDGIPMGYVYPAIQPSTVRLKESVCRLHSSSGKTFTTNTEYAYVSARSDIVSRVVTTESTGDVVAVDYRYPFDFVTPVMQNMTSKNMISTPVKRITYRNGSLIREEMDNYMEFGTTGIPRLSKSLYRTLSEADWITDKTIHSYDAYGNPTHVTSNGLDIVYLWYYDGQYPIAEIRNATPEDVTEALNSSQQSGSIFNVLDSLRHCLPKALVTTITYRPGVGMTSITDPRGLITNYYYDNLDRLVKITEKTSSSAQENIVSYYSYNYAK